MIDEVTIYHFRRKGKSISVTVVRGSPDDIALQKIFEEQAINPKKELDVQIDGRKYKL